MEYTRSGDLIALRVNRGEEIISCVKAVCEKEQVHFGSISGIGAVDHVVVGLYHVADKRYESNTFDGEVEMTSLLGNATEKDGQVYLHFHAAFAKEDGQVVGGHLNEARVSGTAEIFIHTAPGSIGRKADPVTGLNLFDF
ncbi:MAG TPA: PPC domain-containing DNA-binding protein [Clostridia bacterium]|nr:PPC domain-containing DNA-binding protein [Clostridia bacterium]